MEELDGKHYDVIGALGKRYTWAFVFFKALVYLALIGDWSLLEKDIIQLGATTPAS